VTYHLAAAVMAAATLTSTLAPAALGGPQLRNNPNTGWVNLSAALHLKEPEVIKAKGEKTGETYKVEDRPISF